MNSKAKATRIATEKVEAARRFVVKAKAKAARRSHVEAEAKAEATWRFAVDSKAKATRIAAEARDKSTRRFATNSASANHPVVQSIQCKQVEREQYKFLLRVIMNHSITYLQRDNVPMSYQFDNYLTNLGHVHRHNFLTQKHKNIPFPPENRYLRRSAWRSTVQGSRHTWTLKKNIVLNIVSLPPLNYPPSMLAVLLAVVLVVMLLSCCCCCLYLLCCCVANTAVAATVGTPPPPPPLPPPSVGEQDDPCWQQGWWASEGRGNKEGNYDGNEGGKQ